jgi:hypothetical protein
MAAWGGIEGEYEANRWHPDKRQQPDKFQRAILLSLGNDSHKRYYGIFRMMRKLPGWRLKLRTNANYLTKCIF